MHAPKESCNKSGLWSMQSEEAILADAIVIIYYYHNPLNSCGGKEFSTTDFLKKH